jgi:hypothetical protein
MSMNAVLTISDSIKKAMLRIDEKNPGEDGFIYSMMPMGQPVNPADFRDPWSPYEAGTDPIPADATSAERAKADEAAQLMADRIKSAANLSRFTNRKIKLNMRGEVQPGSSDIDDTWDTIVNTAGVAVAAPKLTPDAKKRLEEAETVIRMPRADRPGQLVRTPQYDAYVEYKKKYDDIRIQRAAAYGIAMRSAGGINAWPTEGKVWNSRVKDAYDEWSALGARGAIESALTTINAQGRDAAAYIIERSREAYRAWQFSPGQAEAALLSYVQCFPSDWSEPNTNAGGWVTVSCDQFDKQEKHSTSAQNWGASAGASFGFWSIGGGGGSSSRTEHSDYNSDSLEVQLTVGQVMIDRPWLSTSLLNVKGWGLPGQDKYIISNGGPLQEAAVPGANEATWLPALPTHMIVVKNVRIRSASVQRFFDERVSTSGGSASFGWGPFSFGGSGGSSSSEKSSSCHMENGWLIIDGTQLIGWVLEVMPPSPSESMMADK